MHPGKRQCRSLRMTSRRCTAVAHRRARPSNIVRPTSSSIATANLESHASRRTTSRCRYPPASSSPARSETSPFSEMSVDNGTWATTKNEVGAPCTPSGRPRTAADRISHEEEQGVVEALVPSRVAVELHLFRGVHQERLHLGVVLRGELGRDRSVAVVAPKRSIVAAGIRLWGAFFLGTGEGSELANGARTGRVTQLLVRLGSGGVDDGSDLVEGHLAPAQGPGQPG